MFNLKTSYKEFIHTLFLLFLYIMLKIKTSKLINAEKLLEIMIIKSSFLIPYKIHNINPEINVTSITTEISFAFFSFISLINCGNMDIAVNALALIPISVFEFILFYLKQWLRKSGFKLVNYVKCEKGYPFTVIDTPNSSVYKNSPN